MSIKSSPLLPPMEALEKHLVIKAKMEQLTGMLGLRSLQARQHQNELNDAAAGKALRQQLYNQQETDSEESVQGSTILGDVHYPAPVIVQQPASAAGGLLKAALIAAVSVAVPGAGVAGWAVKELLDRVPAIAASQQAPAATVTPQPTIVENTPQPVQPGLDLQLLQIDDLTQ